MTEQAKYDRKLHGVFVIDRDALKDLDAIAQKHYNLMAKQVARKVKLLKAKARETIEERLKDRPDSPAKEQHINEYVESTSIPYRLGREEYSWRINFHEHSDVTVSDINDVLTRAEFQTARFKSAKLTIQRGEFDATIELQGNDLISAPVETSFTPYQVKVVQDFSNAVETWANDQIQHPIICLWNKFWPLFGLATFYVAIYLLMSFAYYLSAPRPNEELTALCDEVEGLISDGITSENEHAAMLAILRIQLLGDSFGRPPTTPPIFLTGWRTAHIGALVVGLAATFMVPSTAIAIGDGQRRVKRMRLRIRMLRWFWGVLAALLTALVVAAIKQQWPQNQ